MFYSELVKKACNIMFEVHKDDKDKGGQFITILSSSFSNATVNGFASNASALFDTSSSTSDFEKYNIIFEGEIEPANKAERT